MSLSHTWGGGASQKVWRKFFFCYILIPVSAKKFKAGEGFFALKALEDIKDKTEC
jgi:hypothetical protein